MASHSTAGGLPRRRHGGAETRSEVIDGRQVYVTPAMRRTAPRTRSSRSSSRAVEEGSPWRSRCSRGRRARRYRARVAGIHREYTQGWAPAGNLAFGDRQHSVALNADNISRLAAACPAGLALDLVPTSNRVVRRARDGGNSARRRDRGPRIRGAVGIAPLSMRAGTRAIVEAFARTPSAFERSCGRSQEVGGSRERSGEVAWAGRKVTGSARRRDPRSWGAKARVTASKQSTSAGRDRERCTLVRSAIESDATPLLAIAAARHDGRWLFFGDQAPGLTPVRARSSRGLAVLSRHVSRSRWGDGRRNVGGSDEDRRDRRSRSRTLAEESAGRGASTTE